MPGKLFGQEDVRETPATDLVQSNFNSIDFLVSGNVVNLGNKTAWWSCEGINFVPVDPTDAWNYATTAGYVQANEASVTFSCPVFLPNRVIIREVIVYGNISDENWILRRSALNGGASSNISDFTAINSSDATLTNNTVDNLNYGYRITTTSLDNGDRIYGVVIAYTTDYD